MMTNKNSRIYSTDSVFSKNSVSIQSSQRLFDGYFKIDLLHVESQGSSKRQLLKRYVFERGDAVAVLLIDSDKEKIVLVRQLRIAPVVRDDNGWLLEIVAGAMDPDDSPKKIAEKEVREETGVACSKLTSQGCFYLSPGGASERCFLFFAEVNASNLQGKIGGEEGTDEQTIVEVYGFNEILQLLNSGQVVDAKTIIALQKFLLARQQRTGDNYGVD